jgi:hypothetical protein
LVDSKKLHHHHRSVSQSVNRGNEAMASLSFPPWAAVDGLG